MNAAGVFLAQHGVSSRVFDKAAGPSKHPQAHYINNRTMELFRSIRLRSAAVPSSTPGTRGKEIVSLASAVSALSPPLDEWRRFRYVDDLVQGQLYGEIDHFSGTKSIQNLLSSLMCRVFAFKGHIHHNSLDASQL